MFQLESKGRKRHMHQLMVVLVKSSCSPCSEPFCSTWNSSCGEGNGSPRQCSCLENPVDGETWWAAVHGIEKSQTRLSDFTFTFHFHALEKEMATHSSVLAWGIPGTEEAGGLLSVRSYRVAHDRSDLAVAAELQLLKWRSFTLEKGICLSSLLIQMLISSENILTDTLRINQISGNPKPSPFDT